MADSFLSDLEKIYPSDRLLTGRAEVVPYESDGLTAYRARPRGVVLPETADEVIQSIKLCKQHDVPFMARGSGTSLSGGSVPVEDGLVLALNRLDRILCYDPQQRFAIIEPGVINSRISQIAAADGLYYAPDPSSGPVCTIGGNVAFNSGGAHCLKYGMTSNHVLGLKVVLPDGEIVTLGSESLENVGPDLTGMFVGSEGLFGVALEVTVRLLPKPEIFCTVIAAYDTLTAAGTAVSMIVASGLLPGAMEIMDRLAMDAASAAVGAIYPEKAQAVLIVELEGPQEEVRCEEPRLLELLDQSQSFDIHVAANEEERLMIWKGRKSAFSAAGRLSPDFIVQDGVVPRSKLSEALAGIEEIGARHGCRVANVFHAGDGNLHPLILYDGRQSGAYDRAELCAAEILRLCISLGGSITGEHGVGMEKLMFLKEMYGQKDTEFMHQIRDAVDPQRLANRGKMLASAEAPALSFHGAHPLEKQGIIFRD
ncbi:MAG: FAD-binding protein [Planctomycetales bacterium]